MGLFDILRRLFFTPPQRPAPRAPVTPRRQAPAPQTNWPAPVGRPPPPAAQHPLTQESPAPAAGASRPRQATLDLDASPFQPLSTEQVKAQAAGTTFTGFFEFGRQSRIPSAVDARTKLI